MNVLLGNLGNGKMQIANVWKKKGNLKTYNRLDRKNKIKNNKHYWGVL